MSTPAVSVLLPCYNAASTLEECLASLEAQTFTDYEVVARGAGGEVATGYPQNTEKAWRKTINAEKRGVF
jgi:GT2 family glycosyltransferase